MVSAIAPLPNTPRWVERDLRRGIKLVNPEYYAICECIFGTLYRYIYIRDCVSENRDKTYSFVSHYPRTVTFEGWSEVSLAKTRLLSRCFVERTKTDFSFFLIFFPLINNPPRTDKQRKNSGRNWNLQREGYFYLSFSIFSNRFESIDGGKGARVHAKAREKEKEGRRSPNKPGAVLATRRIRINQMKFRLY